MTHVRPVLAAILASWILPACGGGQAPTGSPSSASARPPDAAPVVQGPTTTADGALITARTLLERALAEGARWQPDAQLIGVNTSLADGPAHGFWWYDLQSPSTGTCTRLRAMANGRVDNVGSGDSCVLMKPVSSGFIDSAAAYQAALDAGFRKGTSVAFSLRFLRDQALPAPRECWVVWSDADGDEQRGVIRGWCIDPVSGIFVARLSGYGRSETLR